MIAKKFVVLLFVGVVCNNVCAIRQLEAESKAEVFCWTLFGAGPLCINIGPRMVPVPSETATTNGLGSQLSTVDIYTSSSGSGYSDASAAAGPGGPSGNTYASGSGYTSGSVSANGPSATGYSGSGAYGEGNTNAAAGPGGATANGMGNGSGSTYSDGSAGR